jgi:hypothetical protein
MDGEVTVTVIAGKLPVTLTPLLKIPIPNVTTGLPPPGGVTAEEVASVSTNWTGPVKAPAGTVATIVALPTVAVAVPPLGGMVVVDATVPGRPVAVPPTAGVPGGV